LGGTQVSDPFRVRYDLRWCRCGRIGEEQRGKHDSTRDTAFRLAARRALGADRGFVLRRPGGQIAVMHRILVEESAGSA
jgi:hypothetical protein